MNHLSRWLVWLSRIHKCRGFGIQSPTDYAFVRYVVNEHWPYYAYAELKAADRLTQKLGRLYFRLANWRQTSMMLIDNWQTYWHAGCHKTQFLHELSQVELTRVDITDVAAWDSVLSKCTEHSVVVVEGIYKDWQRWDDIRLADTVGTTFDLYYCGIVFFEHNKYKHNYIINF